MPIRDASEETPTGKVLPKTGTPCDVCGGPTYEARCKIVCRRCGYTRDCSDP